MRVECNAWKEEDYKCDNISCMASNNKEEDTDWKLCILCQKDKKRKEKCRSTEEGISSLCTDLLKFYNIREPDYRPNELCINENNLVGFLISKNAKYHNYCCPKYNDNHYQNMIQNRQKRKLEQDGKCDEDNAPGPSQRRRCYKWNTFQLGKLICCFCEEEDEDWNLLAAGTSHASDGKITSFRLQRLTKEWKRMDALLKDSDLLV